jgi:hypothetical protein
MVSKLETDRILKNKISLKMSREFEYYRIHRKGDSSIPLLDEQDNCPDYFYDAGPINNPDLMLFKLGKPIPKKPKMADYLSTPNSVISKKIFDVLMPLNVHGIQLLPAKVRGRDNESFNDYWAIHVYNKIKCVDVSLSDCTVEDINLEDVKKIVLDRNILKEIPLRARLIFRLKEDFAYQLYHVSIVEAILATTPEGVAFTNIEKWNEGTFFDN